MLTYNPNLPLINGPIRKHFHLLESSPELKELFPPNSITASYRRPMNLKEILAEDAQAAGCFKCDKTKCDLCKKFLVDSKTFSSAQTGKTYMV